MKSASAIVRTALAPFRTERALHICVLCAFVFSEPLFFALTQQFVYLHDLEVGWGEIGYVLLLLTVVIPVIWILLDQLVMWICHRWKGRGQNVVLGLLLCLVWLVLMRPYMRRIQFLEYNSIIWLTSLAIAIPAAILSLQLYLRSQWTRRWISVAAIGIVFFPGLFLYRFGSLKSVDEHSPHTVQVENPAPVIVIVFDEFSGLTLMDRDLQIDAKRFPQFARLAGMSTWYRQASTVHSRTDVAVPALLTGRYPAEEHAPLQSEHPGNLFELIYNSGEYDMTVYEPITRLCPKGVLRRRRVQRTSSQKISSLTETLVAVYPRLILPRDTPVEFPPISRLWFGMSEGADDFRFTYQHLVDGLRQFNPFTLRDEQLRKFVSSIHDGEKPPFNFMHVELPHIPWCFLPSGRQYNFDEGDSFRPGGAWGEIGEDWGSDAGIIARNEYRYLLQVTYVDRFIGQLLDRLQDTDLLDRCLLIVTADHGVSVRPGHSRRVPDTESMPDLLSVPLFIKLPQQTEGKINDSNVESIDVLPTVAEVLGISLKEPVDGISTSLPTRRARKTLYFDHTMTALEPTIPRMTAAVNRRWEIFGSDSLDRPPAKAVSHPDWQGRSTRDFAIVDRKLESLKIEPPYRSEMAGLCEWVPALVWGTLDTQELREPSADLVLAVNGVVVDSGITFSKWHTVHGFEFLLPEKEARQTPSQIELFQVERGSDPPRLRRLKKWNLEHPR